MTFGTCIRYVLSGKRGLRVSVFGWSRGRPFLFSRRRAMRSSKETKDKRTRDEDRERERVKGAFLVGTSETMTADQQLLFEDLF